MPTTTQASFDATKNINAGYIKKNRRPPAAGIGRKRGSLNHLSRTTREFIHEFLAFNAPKVQEGFERIFKKDPYKALQIYTNFLEYDVAKLARTEVLHTGDPLVSLNITNDAEAAATYQSILGNTKFDLSKITFAPPHSVVAEQDQK